jgi:acetyl-CoA synthetase
VLHDAVAEAAVVGYPHDIKGQGIYAYVTLMAGRGAHDELKKELVKLVRTEIGPIATPDIIQWAPGLPKTRSARSCAASCARSPNEVGALGDTSTLADPGVVDDLIQPACEHRRSDVTGSRLHVGQHPSVVFSA